MIEEMAEFCKICGAPLQKGVRFCPKCGTNVGQAVHQQPTYQQQPMATQQPYYGQTQPYVPMPKKSHKKLIIAVVAIVAIIIIIGLLVFFFVLANDEAKIVGKWELEETTGYLNGNYTYEEGTGVIIEFRSDGTVITTSSDGVVSEAEWELDDDKICITSNDTLCYSYEFTDNGNKLIMTAEWSPHSEYHLIITYHLKKI